MHHLVISSLHERRIDVVADSEYIDKDVKIKVLRVEGIKVVVTAVKENIN